MSIQKKINKLTKRIITQQRKVDKLNESIKILESHRDDFCFIRDIDKFSFTELKKKKPKKINQSPPRMYEITLFGKGGI